MADPPKVQLVQGRVSGECRRGGLPGGSSHHRRFTNIQVHVLPWFEFFILFIKKIENLFLYIIHMIKIYTVAILAQAFLRFYSQGI